MHERRALAHLLLRPPLGRRRLQRTPPPQLPQRHHRPGQAPRRHLPREVRAQEPPRRRDHRACLARCRHPKRASKAGRALALRPRSASSSTLPDRRRRRVVRLPARPQCRRRRPARKERQAPRAQSRPSTRLLRGFSIVFFRKNDIDFEARLVELFRPEEWWMPFFEGLGWARTSTGWYMPSRIARGLEY